MHKFLVIIKEGFCWTRTGERQASRMRVRYLKAVLRQDVGYFDLKVSSSSEVVNNVSNDSLVIQDVLREKVPNLIMNVSTFIGSYITAFVLLWRLALVAFPSVVVLIIPGLMYGRILIGLARKMLEEYNKAAVIAEQAISSIRTVYSFVGESRTMAEFSKALDGSVKLGIRQGFAKGLAIGSNGITFAIWSFMVWYGSRLIMYHGANGGTVFAVGASIAVGGLTLGTALSNMKYITEACSAGERIMEVISRIPEIDSDNMGGEVLEDVRGEIEFKNVEFAYPSRPGTTIFEDFSLKVPAGETLALVGGSGSGKSTVISLLERFYDPLGGDIFLDGVSIKKLQLKWLRLQMALVSQEPALFATSIKENIRFGKEDATEEEVDAAARAANAHIFISQLPQGYDTQVGERGIQMSGGQKQRIAIARAIIKSPKILLLDEATSALDSESERVVQEALDQARVGRTTIIVAHRLSTIRNADTIAVVQGGQVMEVGSHESLIQDEKGLYSSLVRLQKTKDKEEGQNSLAQENLIGATSRSMSGRIQRLSRSSSMDSAASTQTDMVVSPSEPVSVPSFKRLLLINRSEWKEALTGCIAATAFGAIQPTYALAMGSMISVFFLPSHSEIENKVRIYALIFVFLAVFSFLVNIIEHYNFAAMGEALTKRIRERMLSKILTFEVGWFDEDENSSGVICSRLAKDANVVRSLVGDRISLLVQTASAVVIACTMGLVIAWRLAIVMIAVQPIIIICYYARRVLLQNMSKKAIRSQDESCKLAAEAVSNLRTVTAFSSQARILNMFELAQEAPNRESARQSWHAGVGLGTSQSLMACTWALDFWYGGRLISDGYIGAKQLLQTFFVLISTGRVIADAGSMTSDLAKGADAVSTVFSILDRYTKIEPDDPEGYKPEALKGQIELKDVDFAYPSRPDIMIFKSFSLKLEVGKSTALVGQSGSGKSTIICLIERFYDPIKGVIRIDGRDIRSYNLRSLRKHIALVGQEPTLFAGTIRENITYGKENATEAEIVDAARAANAHEFIGSLKDGYETWCGDRGVQLSGGQKQRIAIARAILKNPAILLLDEATSALDSQSEKAVQEALDRVMVGRTSVVVAHRLATIQNCDTIAVLENGRVVEKGSHGALLARGGSYFSLVKLQNRSKGSK
ncbi:putative multidrug resistance protein isoform X2 [Nymphaea colorata]|uniref:putative multidrug resistance protein isoform X2 n=1 Tax=Nymphaea colorata TaxID=210225 RepID=UPI00129E6857|nr:putative multidrug resistance protein isoform X2 [Nymphaea colorata]